MAGGPLATLLVKIGADVADVKKGVDKATRDLEGVKTAADRIDKAVASSFGNLAKSAAAMAAGMVTAEVAMRAVGAVTETVVSAVKGVANAFVDTVRQTVQLGDTLFGLSQKTGISVEALSALRFAASQTNTSLETITNAVFKMQTTLGRGGEATAKAVSQLGLSLRELRSADPAAAFTRIIDALGQIPNATQRAALGAQIFGRQFKDIAQLSQENLGDLVAQAQRLGVVMSTETAVAADRFNDAMAAMSARAEALAVKIGATLLPGLLAFVEAISESFITAVERSGVSLNGLGSVIDEVIVGVGHAAAALIEIIANMVDAVVEFASGRFIASLAVVDIFKDIASSALLAGKAVDLAFNFGRLGPVFDKFALDLARISSGIRTASDSVLTAGAGLRSLAQVTATIASDVGGSFRQTFQRVKAEIAQAAVDMRRHLGGATGDIEADISDLTKAFDKLQDKVRGVDLVKTAKAWELALRDPMNVAFTFADRALSTELRDALDAVVIKFGDLKTAGVGAMDAIHDAVRRRLTPAIREGLEGIRRLPGEFLSIFDALRPGVFEGIPRGLGDVGRTNIVPPGLAENITRPFREAFVNIGRELPQLIFGAIQSGQSVIGTVAAASASHFMKVFSDAVARIARTPGGGRLALSERLAGLAGVGLASLAGGIALGSQTTSLTTGALAGAASGALGGLPLAASTGGASVLIGAGAGLFGGLLGAIKGKKEQRQALEATKAQFEAQFGGMTKLRELAEKAGLSIDRVFNAKTPQAFNQAVKLVNEQLAAYNKHLEGLNTALSGVNQRALTFANNFSALIAKRDELLQSGGAGSQIEEINAKIAEIAQRTQPEFERIGLMVRDVFAGLVRETGDAFGAIQQLAPAFQVLQDGIEKFGLTSTAAIDELLANFRLINDETFGPFLQNIQASGQVLKGLFDAKALSPEGFQAIAADIGQSFQEIANRGGDITRALALNQPILQALWEAQQRFGAVTDQTTQSILRQAEEQGLVGEHMKDVNERILDVLIAIADVFGAKLPESVKKSEDAFHKAKDAIVDIGDQSDVLWRELELQARDAARDVTNELRRIEIPRLRLPVEFEMVDGVPRVIGIDQDTRIPIPAFASGGIVRRPTLGIVGEAGPEAVIPLERLGSGVEGAAQATVVFERGAFEGVVVDNDERVEQLARRIFTAVRRGNVRSAAITAGFAVR